MRESGLFTYDRDMIHPKGDKVKLASACPYQDICSTTLFWESEKARYIKEVCKTEEHKECTHFLGLDANPSWVEEARKKMNDVKKCEKCGRVTEHLDKDGLCLKCWVEKP